MSRTWAARLAAAAIVTASLAVAAEGPAPVELQERNFRAEIDGKPVGLYTIRNANGMVARLTNFGARIEQILVPDREGRLGDVAQGYETIDEVRDAVRAFAARYNAEWLIEKNGHRSPDAARAAWNEQTLRRAA